MSIPAGRCPRWEEGVASTRVRFSTPSHDGRTTTEAPTDDLLVEIISRVPSRQRWRCKCVFKRWLRLARTLPQCLAGFFCTTTSEECFPRTALHFFNASGSLVRPLIYPSFAFLPSHRQIDLLDCCNGLLLCRWYGVSSPADDEFSYVVCNPVTEQWVALPEGPSHSRRADSLGTACLGFDPAVSSHFHVFMLLVGAGCYPNKPITGVDVYSSETGRWVHKEKGCDVDVRLAGPHWETVFLNGYLHFHSVDAGLNPGLAAVDTDGETWMNIVVLGNEYLCFSFIQHSQGRLHYAGFSDDDNLVELVVVYVLEDYDNKQWALKHRAEVSYLFQGGIIVDDLDSDFDWLAIHPECNVIFFTAGAEKTFMWYNMDNQRSDHIRILGIGDGQSPYLAYAPLYSELQSLHT